VSDECYDDMGRIMLHKYMVYVLAKYEFCRWWNQWDIVSILHL